MIDRLLPPEHSQIPEQRTRVQDNGPRDFKDWLQSPPQHSGNHADDVRGDRIQEARTPLTVGELHGAAREPAAGVPGDVHVQLHFMKSGGQQESVVVPMRLAATGRLAWVTSIRATGIPTVTSRECPIGPLQSVAAQSERTGTIGTGYAMASGDAVSMSVTSHPSTDEPLSQVGGDDMEIRSGRAWLTGAAESWLQRLLRWTQRHGHDPVVWIRDYRLDGGGARDLTRSLQSRARAEGFELARIIVNGRELWRAPSYSHSQEKL
jgi:hypothetical protein